MSLEELKLMLHVTGWSYKMKNGILTYSVFGMGTLEFSINENGTVADYLEAMIACCHKYCCYFWKDGIDYKKGYNYTHSELIADLLKEKQRLANRSKR